MTTLYRKIIEMPVQEFTGSGVTHKQVLLEYCKNLPLIGKYFK